MLKRIHVQNFKSLNDVDVTLSPLSVLFGPNASGKSNLLDALQLLSRIVSCKSLQEAFEHPYRGLPLESVAFGPDGIIGIGEKESVSFSFEIDVKLSDHIISATNKLIREMRKTIPEEKTSESGELSKLPNRIIETYLRYRIEIEILTKTGIARVADESVCALKRNGELKARKPFLSREENGRLRLRMEGQSHPFDYDIYLNHSILSLPLYPPHYPHITALKKELESWRFFYFEPREKMRVPAPAKEITTIGSMGENLSAFLNTLKASHAAQFNNMNKSLNWLIPSISGIHVEVNKFGTVDLDLIENDVRFSSRLVSEGTLRLLGMLAINASKEPPALVGFEEPENGIPPQKIKHIVEFLENLSARTQVIASTHSPIIPEILPNSHLFTVRKKGGKTQIDGYDNSKGSLFREDDIDIALSE